MRMLAAVGCLALTTCAPAPAPAPVPAPRPERGQPAPAVAPPRALAIATPALVPTPLPNDLSHTTIHRLSNGMTVYLSPDPAEPSLAARIVVKAGYAYDPPTSTGLAHYLEHMLFKGTASLGTLDFAKEKPHLDRIAALYADLRRPGADRDRILTEIDRENLAAAEYQVPSEFENLNQHMGLRGVNAFTDSDVTEYIADIPKNRLAQWARVQADRFTAPAFRQFWPEMEAVYEEKNKGLDNPERNTFEAFAAALYPQHGYGQLGLGETEHLKTPAYADMVAFFTRYYTPQNMAIVLSGDVDASVLPVLEKEFAGFRRAPGDAPAPRPLPPVVGRREVTVQVPSGEGIWLGWHLVPATHPDRAALAMLDLLLLDNTGAGLVERDLRLPQKVAGAGASPTFLRESGYYTLWADALDKQTPEQLEALLLGVIGKLQRGEFSDADLATALLSAEITQQEALESNAGRASLMDAAFVNGEEWSAVAGRLDRLRAVTRADIIRVATTYFGPSYVVVKRVRGDAVAQKIAKPKITPVSIASGRQSAFAAAILAMPIAPIEPVTLVDGKDYVRGKLGTGELVTVANARNGLFSATWRYDFGRRDDRLACYALGTLPFSGLGARPAADVARELHALGLTLETSCGGNLSSITLSGTDRNLEAGMTLLRGWLADPTIDAPILAARLATAKTQRANEVASPAGVAAALDHYARWGDQSDQLLVASNQQLEAARPADLRALLQRYLTMAHRTQYFGPRPHAAASAAVVLGSGKRATTKRPGAKFRAPPALFATDQTTAQTHVWVLWPRAPSNAVDRASGELFDRYAGWLLYQEVRQSRGLAYTAYGGYQSSARAEDAGYVYAYAGTQGDKTHDALDAIFGALALPIDDTRFAQAKTEIEERFRIDRIAPRAIAGAVYAWEDQGEAADPRAARVARALAVDRGAFGAWIQGAIARPKIVSVVGDRKKLDEGRLRAVAPTTFVPVSKLFGY